MNSVDVAAKIESIIACPQCLGGLEIEGEDVICSECKAAYKKRNGKYYFREIRESDRPDVIDRAKGIIRRHEKLYAFFVSVVAPTFKSINLRKFVSAEREVVVDLGSGNTNVNDSWIKIDYFDYPNVHIVCDCEKLPFKSNSVDVQYNISVLEHVSDPYKVVSQIHRTLKKGGIVVSSVPFLVPYHASPHDYHRFTSSGVLNLYKDFAVLELGGRSGPFSALLWIFQETIASLLSLGSTRIRHILLVFLYLALFPFKFLDAVFLVYPFRSIENIASNFYFVGRKE